MSDTDALEPCPFCGGKMMLREALWPSEGDTDAVVHAEPTECPIEGCFSIDTADQCVSVAAAWNRRALASLSVGREAVAWRWRWNDMSEEESWCLSNDDPRHGSTPTRMARFAVVEPLVPASALAAFEAKLAEALKVLRDHHEWHTDAGAIGLPDGEGGWVEIDNAAEYCDSRLYERTAKALADMPPEFKPMPRGGWTRGSNHWEDWQLAMLRLKVSEVKLETAERERDEALARAEQARADTIEELAHGIDVEIATSLLDPSEVQTLRRVASTFRALITKGV